MKKSYGAMGKLLGAYWNAYGGFDALIKSPFLHVALAISGLSYQQWLYESWWELPIAVIPNLLGFTLGGYAIMLAFGDNRFTDLLRSDGKEKTSPYMRINSSFVHFLLLQVLALLIALIFAAEPISSTTILQWFHPAPVWLHATLDVCLGVLNFFGFATFVYSITAGGAAVLSIFQVAKNYDGTSFDTK